jgi:hypothetical protein
MDRRRSGLLAGATSRSDAASAWPSLRGLRRGCRGRRGGLALPIGLPGTALHLAAFRSGFLVACVARLLRGSCPLAPLHASRLRVRRDDAGKRHDGGQRTGHSSQSHSPFHARSPSWVGLHSTFRCRRWCKKHTCRPRERRDENPSVARYACERWRAALPNVRSRRARSLGLQPPCCAQADLRASAWLALRPAAADRSGAAEPHARWPGAPDPEDRVEPDRVAGPAEVGSRAQAVALARARQRLHARLEEEPHALRVDEARRGHHQVTPSGLSVSRRRCTSEQIGRTMQVLALRAYHPLAVVAPAFRAV